MRFTYRLGDETKIKAEAWVVPVFAGWEKEPPVAHERREALRRRAEKTGFTARDGEKLVLSDSATDLILVGVGKPRVLTNEEAWTLGQHVAQAAMRVGAARAACRLPFLAEQPAATLVAFAKGAGLAAYRFDRYLTQESPKPRALESLDLVASTAFAPAPAVAKKALARAEALIAGITTARDLGNEPANILTPAELAVRVAALGKAHGFRVTVEEEKQIAKRGMNLFLAVAQGAANRPRLLILRHEPAGSAKQAPIVLVGKGLMFDAGGLCLKEPSGMETMKADMAGAAAVIGAMHTLALLKVKRPIIAIVAACENMPDGNAFRMGDIFRAANGKTVEIMNTDAEGRLALADSLVLAESFKPAAIVDVATLTGACVVSLGEQTAGLFSDDTPLADTLAASFMAGGEVLWRLPLDTRLRPFLKSEVADMKNVGIRYGGAITAGLFLKEFVSGTPWAHLDIAGPSFAKSAVGPFPKGASGYAVSGLVEWLAPFEA